MRPPVAWYTRCSYAEELLIALLMIRVKGAEQSLFSKVVSVHGPSGTVGFRKFLRALA